MENVLNVCKLKEKAVRIKETANKITSVSNVYLTYQNIEFHREEKE